jgi:putative aldouronate transport system permease protein
MKPTASVPRYRRAKPISWARLAVNIILTVMSVACVVPLLLVISASLTEEKALVLEGYKLIPSKISLYAYRYVLLQPDQIMRAYGVTIAVTVIGSVLGLLVMSLLAYVLSRQDFVLRRALSFYVFFTMLFNGGLVPWYILIARYLQMKDTLAVLIVPLLVNAWWILLLRTYFQGIPKELLEAAKMDGAGEWRVFFQVAVPLSTPALATVGLFAMLRYWNDWWMALLFIEKPRLVPLQYLLYAILKNIDFLASNPQTVGVPVPVQPVRMAMAVMAIGPIIFGYLFVQKYFVRGITLGSFK